MQDENERRAEDRDSGSPDGTQQTRAQQGGEGGTTRFGMEDGDNTDVPATGGPDAGDEASERAS